MTKEELTSGISRPRSRELMRVFKDTEFVEQLGSGMNRMMNVYKPDIFHISPNSFHVVFYFDEEKTDVNNMSIGTINGSLNPDDRLNDRLNRQNDRINDSLKFSESELAVLGEIQKNPFVKTDGLVSLT